VANARACYALQVNKWTTCLSIRIAKAKKCKPAKVSGKRLRIALSSAGTQIGEAAGSAARAALEQNCPLDAAAHAAFSAGLPPETPLRAIYDVTEKPVWHIAASANEGVKRLIDGMSCAVLVSR